MGFTRLPILLAGVLAVTAFAQEAHSVFGLPVLALTSPVSIVATLDFDGDGDVDVVTQSTFGSVNYAFFDLYSNQGDGALVFARSLGFLSTSSVVGVPRTVSGDVGIADGRGDVVFAYGKSVSGSLHTSSGDFPIGPFAFADAIRDLAIDDLNGDGRGDFVVVTDSTLVLFRHVGLVGFAPTALPIPAQPDRQLLLGDVTGDGIPDVTLFEPSMSRFTRVPFNGTTFATAISTPLSWAPEHATLGDVDQDGDLDLAFFGVNGGIDQYQIVRQTSAGVFVAETPMTGGPATDLADVDGDGDLDGVLCGDPATPQPISDGQSPFLISINDGTGHFAPAFSIPNVGAYRFAGCADMDGDGDRDLVAGRGIYFAQGPLSPQSFSGPASLPLAGRPPVDVDGDSDLDLGFGLDAVWTNRANGTGSVAPPRVVTALPAGQQYSSPGTAGDFDGDGDPDLLVDVLGSFGAVLGLHFLENRGGALFDRGPAFPSGASIVAAIGNDPRRALVSDVDGDGDNDLILRVPSPVGSTLWFNDGLGNFASPSVIANQWVTDVRDFDADGTPDLLTIDQGGDLNFLRGFGTGAFAAPVVEFAMPAGSINLDEDLLAIADFDGDLAPDIVLAYVTAGDGSIVSLRNLGPGATTLFAATTNPGNVGPIDPTRPFRLLAGDINGDGRADLLVSNTRFSGREGMAVLTTTTTSTTLFDPSLVRYAPSAPLIALADLDGDGDLDLLTDQGIFRSSLIQGASAGLLYQFEAGFAGTGGVVPTLGATGPVRPGFPSSLIISGGLGGALSVLVLGTQTSATPVLGGIQYVVPLAYQTLPLLGPPGLAGAGTITLPLGVIPAGLAGLTFYFQAGIVDTAGPMGVSFTNALQATIGL